MVPGQPTAIGEVAIEFEGEIARLVAEDAHLGKFLELLRFSSLRQPVREDREQSDVVSIHCPLTPETKGLINATSLRKMKPTAFLLNTSRGPIVVDEDLAQALNQGIIAGAGIDVLSVEPPSKGNPLFAARNCIITPHIAWATREARSRLMNMAVQNVQAFTRGTPVNIV